MTLADLVKGESEMDLKAIKKWSADDALALIGLQQRRRALNIVATTSAVFAVGALFGAGLILLFAPKAGVEAVRELVRTVSGGGGTTTV